MAERYSVGIDIGGTFTDSVIRDQDGAFVIDKAFTTPGNLVEGVLKSLENAASQWSLSTEKLLSRTKLFKLGTTSPINRLINRAGSKTALLTTRGHEDALFIGRVRQKTDGLSQVDRTDVDSWEKAAPIVPRWLVWGIDERIDSEGEVLCSLNEEVLEVAITECRAQGVVSFAVCFLWSFLNPIHEHMARRTIQRLAPEAFVVLSSDVAPLVGEYERAATTVLNCYLGPGTASDLAALEGALRGLGLHSRIYVMQSSGGVFELSEAVAQPVYLLGSGPVGGVAASRDVSPHLESKNVIATDMGGTSFDVGVIVDGSPIENRVSIHNRYRVLAPSLEVTSIGAGGGSIAFVDELTGVLQVGPESAGSVPGPVCYGFGGTAPTVTDANAVLGRLNPYGFFSGRHVLDIPSARDAIERDIAIPLGVPVAEAAAAIINIVDSRMADLIRNLTIERGFDPTEFTIVAYGGGAPVHVASYAMEIGIRSVIVPRAAPVYSAWGIADSPVLQTAMISRTTALPTSSKDLRTMFEKLYERSNEIHIEHDENLSHREALFVDMRYRYQVNEIPVPVAVEELASDDLSMRLMSRFERLYETRFGVGTAFREAGIEISTFRLVHHNAFVQGTAPVWAGVSPQAIGEERDVWFNDRFITAPIYQSDHITTGTTIEGPCVVEGRLITIVLHPGQHLAVDQRGDFVLMVD